MAAPPTNMAAVNFSVGHFGLPLVINTLPVVQITADYKEDKTKLFLESKSDRPERHAIRNLLGVLAFRRDKVQEAKDYFNKILEPGEDPDNLNAKANLDWVERQTLSDEEYITSGVGIAASNLGPDVSSETEKKRQGRRYAEQAFAFMYDNYHETMTHNRYTTAMELYNMAMNLAGHLVDGKEKDDWHLGMGLASMKIFKSTRLEEHLQTTVSSNCAVIDSESADHDMKSDAYLRIGVSLDEASRRKIRVEKLNLAGVIRDPEMCFKKALQFAISDSQKASIYNRLATFRDRHGDFSGAMEYQSKSICLDGSKNNHQAYSNRARICLKQFKKTADIGLLTTAKTDLEFILKEHVSPWDFINLADVYYRLAKTSSGRQSKEYIQQALDACDKSEACQDGKDRPDCHKIRGQCLCFKEEHGQALESFKRGVECEKKTGEKCGNAELLDKERKHLRENWRGSPRSDTPTSKVPRAAAELGVIQLEEDDEQTQTAKRSVKKRNTSVDGKSKVVTSVEERTTYSKPPIFHGLDTKDCLIKLFESKLEKEKAQNIDVVGRICKSANFAAAILDCRGGCLSIDNLDVHLYVPPGAIPKEQTQRVYILVTGTSSVDNHYFSTPVVHCGPPDAVFDKDVVLTMPHCVKDTSSCKFSVFKLSSDGSRELREGLDVITVVDNDSITLSVNHFCGHAATASPVDGTISRKDVRPCVFIGKSSDSDNTIEIRVLLLANLGARVLKVVAEESAKNFFLANMIWRPMIVYKNDPLVAEIFECGENWAISEPKRKNFDHNSLWSATATRRDYPAVTFSANRSVFVSSAFEARITLTVYQDGSESGNYVMTSIAAKQKSERNPQSDEGETEMDWEDSVIIPSRPYTDELCQMLDGNGWRRLAELLFMTQNASCQFEFNNAYDEYVRRRRPTELFLNLFFSQQMRKQIQKSTGQLRRALVGMNLPDARLIDNVVGEFQQTL